MELYNLLKMAVYFLVDPKVEFSGNDCPYYAFGRAYIRVGDEDRKLSAKEIENMILRKSAVKWDSKISDSEINEINGNTLREFIQKANEAKRINFKYTNKKEVLEKLNMFKDSKISNAAKLLFSKKSPLKSRRQYLQASIRQHSWT